jgi:hypothetical protein
LSNITPRVAHLKIHPTTSSLCDSSLATGVRQIMYYIQDIKNSPVVLGCLIFLALYSYFRLPVPFIYLNINYSFKAHVNMIFWY